MSANESNSYKKYYQIALIDWHIKVYPKFKAKNTAYNIMMIAWKVNKSERKLFFSFTIGVFFPGRNCHGIWDGDKSES